MSVPTKPPARPGLPRLVATDLDGTLVRLDGSVSDYTRSVLRRLDDLGVPVIFVTGRPLRWTEVVFEHVGSLGLAIVSNGALVWDVAEAVPRLERTIATDLALEVCERIRSAVPGSAFAVETIGGFAMEPAYVRHFSDGEARRAPVEELVEEPLLKLLARHEELPAEEYWARAEEAVEDLVTITWSSTSALLEISAPGVTKASTLELVCGELGVDADDVIAFGDMPNDLPMLTWAGTSYAMADAHPSVVSCAAHVAPSHEDDGVARVLAGVFDL
ncbi:HAD family hydrolase [Nocardioides sp. KR10-350]|uniref:HAD family hydrolase n=1 Tax=Nocardioides cheoyonin TaxID=3156615 RepID=UPI0032B4C5AC